MKSHSKNALFHTSILLLIIIILIFTLYNYQKIYNYKNLDAIITRLSIKDDDNYKKNIYK
jgi:hypothetical protein